MPGTENWKAGVRAKFAGATQSQSHCHEHRPMVRCVMRWAALFLFLVGVGSFAQGLFVAADGTLRRGDSEYRGVGVNYYDAFARTLQPAPRLDYDAGLAELARRKIPFARFSAGGYWPADWKLYQTNRAEHFARLDGVVKSAERHGIGLIPSLFWQLSTVPDLVGEPVNRWGDTNSRTCAFMREYTREVVTRYVNSPAVWGWEFGNEFNLVADLPNASQHRPPVVPQLGTPRTRTAEDELTHEMIRTAFQAFAQEVRRFDRHRVVITGNAFPRPSAWHQAHEKTWRRDTPEQFAEVLAADNPSPVDTLSVRGYDLTNDLGRLARAMAISRTLKKPLFVGEFGVAGPSGDEAKTKFISILRAIETNGVPLAALWVFDFSSQAKDWNVTGNNGRDWQLDAIQQLNARMAARR